MTKIWAVAHNTISQALRMKVSLLVILLLLILLPMLGSDSEGDGTLKGKLQTFVSYGLSLTSVLLCALSIAISIFCITDDIKRRRIYLVATKPIRRSQILIGKFLGLSLLNLFLLTVYASIIYGATLLLPIINKSNDEEIAIAQRQFFTARKELGVKIEQQQLVDLAKDNYDQLEKLNQLPETMTHAQI